MGMQTDVLSAVATASGSMISGRTRLKGFALASSATAGSVVFRDGSASGTVLLTLNTPASAGLHGIVVPGEGVLFSSGVYAVLTNVTSVTIFYG